MTSPIYSHDCDCCKFLGSVNHDGKWRDLYACSTSAVIRHGNDGPEYSSAPLSMCVMLGGLYNVVHVLNNS